MRPPKYPADEVVRILALYEGKDGPTIEEICTAYDISIQTFYRWKARFGGITPEQAPKLRELELENARLKRLKKKTRREIRILEKALGEDI